MTDPLRLITQQNMHEREIKTSYPEETKHCGSKSHRKRQNLLEILNNENLAPEEVTSQVAAVPAAQQMVKQVDLKNTPVPDSLGKRREMVRKDYLKNDHVSWHFLRVCLYIPFRPI